MTMLHRSHLSMCSSSALHVTNPPPHKNGRTRHTTDSFPDLEMCLQKTWITLFFLFKFESIAAWRSTWPAIVLGLTTFWRTGSPACIRAWTAVIVYFTPQTTQVVTHRLSCTAATYGGQQAPNCSTQELHRRRSPLSSVLLFASQIVCTWKMCLCVFFCCAVHCKSRLDGIRCRNLIRDNLLQRNGLPNKPYHVTYLPLGWPNRGCFFFFC